MNPELGNCFLQLAYACVKTYPNVTGIHLKPFEYRPGLQSQLLSQRGPRMTTVSSVSASTHVVHQVAPELDRTDFLVAILEVERKNPGRSEKGRQILWIWIERFKNKQGTYIGTTDIILGSGLAFGDDCWVMVL